MAAGRRGLNCRRTASTSRTTSSGPIRWTSSRTARRPTTSREFSITTAVQGADNAGGATQVRMVTPQGTNRFKGSVYEYNRNSRFAANSFFNKRAKPDPIPVADLNRNQFGGSLGGPIVRGKLFFYGNYEGFRQKQQTTQNFTIPAQPDLLTGTFRYVATDGSVRSANVLQLTGQTVDARMRSDVLALYPSSGQGEQLRQRRLARGSPPQHGAVQLSAGRSQRSQPVDRARRLRAGFQEPLRVRLQLVQGDRRSHGPRSHHPAAPAGLHRLHGEAVRGRVALGADVPASERAADWRQPGAGRVRKRRRLQQRGPLQRSQHRRPVDAAAQQHADRPALSAARARHADLPGDQHRILRGRRPPAPVRREPAEDQGEPVQLRRPVPRADVRVQPGRAHVGAAHADAAAGHQRRGLHHGEQPPRVPHRHDHLDDADAAGGESDLRVRGRHSEQPQLQPEQRLGVPAGQLALEAESDGQGRHQVGVLQPAARGRQPRLPAGAQRPLDARRDARPGRDGHLRGRRHVQEGSEQLRPDGGVLVGSVQGRQDGRARGLLARVRQRRDGHRRQ